MLVRIQDLISEREIIGTRGRSKVISTSKIRKITAIRKNRREKGMRADPLGSKPHSKGEFFSRSLIVFFDKTEDTIIRTLAIIKIVLMKRDKDKIVIPGEAQSC